MNTVDPAATFHRQGKERGLRLALIPQGMGVKPKTMRNNDDEPGLIYVRISGLELMDFGKALKAGLPSYRVVKVYRGKPTLYIEINEKWLLLFWDVRRQGDGWVYDRGYILVKLPSEYQIYLPLRVKNYGPTIDAAVMEWLEWRKE